MSLDTVPIIAQESQTYQGLRKFLSTPKVGPSVQYSLSFTTSSNTTWNVICHFQLKQRKLQSAVLALLAASSSQTHLKKSYYFLCLLMEQKKNPNYPSQGSCPLMILPSDSGFRGAMSQKEPWQLAQLKALNSRPHLGDNIPKIPYRQFYMCR